MSVSQSTVSIGTHGKGTQEITDLLRSKILESECDVGTISVFCHHTSCSLVLMENADPSARRDLEDWMERIVPDI